MSKEDYVSLTVNPCKMCMPMGVVNATYGIKGCMTILHGSQGCSTYIRRHMATHFNEPIDIASSSLTEQGTVYGGEKNLLKGLKNLIKLYNPEVIAIATTCLAETIGEDIVRISKIFEEKNPNEKVKLIPISSPGYGGTQFGGYFSALRGIVENVEMKEEKNNKVNIVTGPISPADTRKIKDILGDFNLDYILLPDISENLDGIHKKVYERLPENGTSIEDISFMAGARMTIELTTFVDDNSSVGKYLEENYGVKNIRLNLPRGIRDTDNFLNVLSNISGEKIPEKYVKERGRYLDAMIDSHKYNAEGRIAIFGEPDYVYSTVRMVLEIGVFPVLIATGDVCPSLEKALYEEVKELADALFIEDFKIIDDADFVDIEKYSIKLGANILIGNSDGRRIEEKYNIPLIRGGFPIHDRVGGQRILSIGYEGSLSISDSITNMILDRKHSVFRETTFNKYYKGEKKMKSLEEKKVVTIKDKTKTHPCFSCESAHKYARMHLPIAPKCNISCNYCYRKYDCVNESRPGVTTEVLSPVKAFEKYKFVKSKMPNLKVIGIAGPGDALANFDNVRETLKLIRADNPEMTFCISTNGLMLPFYAEELINLGVSHVTVTMNGINPHIISKIYKYVNYLGVTYTGMEGAEILLTNQLSGIKYLTERGIVVKVNIVMLKGINDKHIYDVTKKAKELGVEITNIMQMIPVKGSVFENMPLVSNIEINEMRKKCGENIKQMFHCKQCRADAIGTLNNDQGLKLSMELKDKKVSGRHLKFAVATRSGMTIDMHFGQAEEFYIYEYRNDTVMFLEKRNVDRYCNGEANCKSDSKIEKLIKTIDDCNGVISLRIGEEPKKKLKENNIRIFTSCERIEDAVAIFAKEIINKSEREYAIK
ncbi:Nitrogenase cofactor biosynthesis protein NifB [Clostridium bornimense]|uniref:FeMo cofactor biosynthesis protein NifB n=1 Tax=Clostridium bornimense TaxID=1216932 RepID=W6S003_9CLOT|nr:nitrogenase cofactor biosynthesis protein NifB [Clostridium bornimense]CDM70236.1 Nitrogenase cofactor biosynthesis protein NifB [Clostridium bornimense]